LRSRFLKKATDKDDKKKKGTDKRAARPKKIKESDAEDDDQLGGDWEVVTGGAQVARPKMFPKDTEINTPAVVKKLAEITAIRGKKVTINIPCFVNLFF
jgi:hypothetical protein